MRIINLPTLFGLSLLLFPLVKKKQTFQATSAIKKKKNFYRLELSTIFSKRWMKSTR